MGSMLDLEIKETKDFDLLGRWVFHKNALTVAGYRCSSGDIKINNESFSREALAIQVSEQGLFIELLDEKTVFS